MKLEKIPEPEQMNRERYFQIREIYKGTKRFENFCVSGDTPDGEIKQIACDEWNAHMEHRERLYYPSPFRPPPKWKDRLDVVEQTRKILPPSDWHKSKGKTFMNEWKTKRKGFRFKIERSWARFTYADGSTRMIRGYSPEADLEQPEVKESESEVRRARKKN